MRWCEAGTQAARAERQGQQRAPVTKQSLVVASPARQQNAVSAARTMEIAMRQPLQLHRRRLVGASLAAGALATGGSLLSVGARAAGKTKINMQLGWLIG